MKGQRKEKMEKTKKYTFKATGYKAPSKAGTGVIGLKLEYVEKGDSHILYAYVKGVRVILSKGRAGVEIRRTLPKTGYSNEADSTFIKALSETEFNEVSKYLCSRYNIENRDHDFLVTLAKKGEALLTKQELKELKAFREGK